MSNNSQQFYYLHSDYSYSKIEVDYIGAGVWVKAGTKQIINSKDLFKELKLLSAEAIRRLQLKKHAAADKLKEINAIIESNKPHPNARATKASYLWVIDDDEQENK